jgi:hypothetical protein
MKRQFSIVTDASSELNVDEKSSPRRTTVESVIDDERNLENEQQLTVSESWKDREKRRGRNELEKRLWSKERQRGVDESGIEYHPSRTSEAATRVVMVVFSRIAPGRR